MCEQTPQASVSLPNDRGAPGRARAFVVEEICRFHAVRLDDVALITSEVVTNAVVHGRPPLQLTVECASDYAEIRVYDAGEGMPTAKYASPFDTSGRGVAIVELLSDEWGVTPDPRGGKTTWFRVHA